MVMLASNLPKAMLPDIYKWFYLRYSLLPDWRDRVFNMETSSREYEEHVGIGAITMADDWGGAVSYGDFYQGYTKKFTHVFKSKGMILEKKLFMFDKSGIIAKRSKMLADAMLRKQLKDGAGFFEDGFTATSDTGDGKALFASNHPSPADAGYSKSNLGTTAYSRTQLASIRLLMLKFTNDRDEQIEITPSLILHPRDLTESIHESLYSEHRWLDSTKIERFANYFRKGGEATWGWDTLEIPQWTDTTDFFVVDEQMMKEYLYWYTAMAPTLDSTGDFDTKAFKIASLMMYSFGTNEWRWGYGSQVA